MNYQQFKEKFNISLNSQQEAAVQSVDKSTLLLAVPGSGKTTVLIAHLGYLIYVKGISPDRLLAVSYNVKSTEEMKSRFSDKLGTDIDMIPDFKTINGLSYSIYLLFCKKVGKSIRNLITEKQQYEILKDVYQKIFSDFPTKSDIEKYAKSITYIKNMMLNKAEVEKYGSENNIANLLDVFEKYITILTEQNLMDFDDQMVFAEAILSNSKYGSSEREYWRSKYSYICVDEAQDTSKIQHKIIHQLFSNNIVFMVGDEDQSIYGFRAAYPKALLSFQNNYRNSIILKMETNYRSTQKIVKLSSGFISSNKNRQPKDMIANNQDDGLVDIFIVKDRKDQYNSILNRIGSFQDETAILFRDNDCALPLVDLFDRNNVTFSLKTTGIRFFENKLVRTIVSYLKLALNNKNYDSFLDICNKGIVYIKTDIAKAIAERAKTNDCSVFDVIQSFPDLDELRVKQLKSLMSLCNLIKKSNTSDSLDILKNRLSDWTKNEKLDSNKFDLLESIADNEYSITGFIKRLNHLEKLIDNREENLGTSNNNIVLSTIHSSKGLEYKRVIIIDIFDNMFPSVTGKDVGPVNNPDYERLLPLYLEERRLLYVGMTRAKSELYLYGIKNKKSEFINELRYILANIKKLEIEAQTKENKKNKYTNSKESSSTNKSTNFYNKNPIDKKPTTSNTDRTNYTPTNYFNKIKLNPTPSNPKQSYASAHFYSEKNKVPTYHENYSVVESKPMPERKIPEKVKRMITQKISFVGVKVSNSEYGEGVITDCTKKEITVRYKNNILKYAFPLAFSMGTIKLK